MKIAISTSTFAKYSETPLQLLRERGIDFIQNEKGRTLTEDEVIQLAQDCVALAAGTEPLNRHVLENLPQLKVISRCGTGVDNIDLDYAKQKGISIWSTPDGPVLAVAELTVGLMLSLLRFVPRQDREMRQGIWKKRMGNLLHGKKVGIVGFGRIGRTVARLLEPFQVEIAYADPACHDTSYPKLDLDELLDWATIVTLHCSKPKNEGYLIDKGRLSMMRPGSYLINVARGGLVDPQALYGLLMAGHLGGAAIDVYPKEPYEGCLCEMDNIILTPHIGSYAREARIIMELDTIKHLLQALENL